MNSAQAYVAADEAVRKAIKETTVGNDHGAAAYRLLRSAMLHLSFFNGSADAAETLYRLADEIATGGRDA